MVLDKGRTNADSTKIASNNTTNTIASTGRETYSYGHDDSADPEHPPKPFSVLVSKRFICLTICSTTLLAFAVGRFARIMLLQHIFGTTGHSQLYYPYRLPSGPLDGIDGSNSINNNENKGLPYPEIMEGKDVPRTRYSSRNFDTAASATSSSVLARRKGASNGDTTTTAVSVETPIDTCINASDEKCLQEEHFPAGQHLLVDMKGIDSAFLDSEERLAQGIVETVKETQLTLLSYHCHTLVPMGVSCVGVLLESHISFHTWPEEGVITLDLFTCGSKPLVPVVPIIERIFGIAPPNSVQQPTVLWSHKLRGFRDDDRNPLQQFDLGKCILGMMDMDMKNEVVSFQTKFQRIDVYDVIRSRVGSLADYEQSISGDGSYQSLHSDLYQPNRIVMLDGIMQSNLHGDASYHEALVHPAMFAHWNPERVAIIGGGEGATLREVLKHKTVEKAIMVEIDQEMVELSHQHLKHWSDCGDLVGSAEWCVEDSRTAVYYEDALQWFMDRYYTDGAGDSLANEKNLENAEPLDVIIVDALDPEDEVDFADVLYNTKTFLEAIHAGLDSDGILVMQLGASPRSRDPPELSSKYRTRAILIQQLEDIGFKSIHIYEESHSGFGDPWSFLVALKQYESRLNWYANEAEIELAIHERVVPTKSGSTPFNYFDGANMMSYQNPHRNFESVFCKQDPKPAVCDSLRGFNAGRANSKVDSYQVHSDDMVAAVEIQDGSYVSIDTSTERVHFHPLTYDMIRQLSEKRDVANELNSVQAFMNEYGVLSRHRGGPEVSVEASVFRFAKREGREYLAVTDDARIYNPVVDRHIPQLQSSNRIFSSSIDMGEKVTPNKRSM